MIKKIIIIISICLLILIYPVFFTPKENDVLYRWEEFSLPWFSNSGEEWKTFEGFGDKWAIGKYVGGTTLSNTVIPCGIFPDFLLGFNNLIFSCNVPHGFGTFYSWYAENMYKYKGEFNFGKEHGQGEFTDFRTGNKIIGFWNQGKMWDVVHFDSHGNIRYKKVKGKHISVRKINEFSNGKYEGQWKDLKWHGEGTFIYPDGRKYEGQWGNWLFNGVGTFTFPDGSYYKGEWKDGEKHGQGTHTLVDGEKIKGQWKEGEPLNCTIYDKKGTVIGKWEIGERGNIKFSLKNRS